MTSGAGHIVLRLVFIKRLANSGNDYSSAATVGELDKTSTVFQRLLKTNFLSRTDEELIVPILALGNMERKPKKLGKEAVETGSASRDNPTP